MMLRGRRAWPRLVLLALCWCATAPPARGAPDQAREAFKQGAEAIDLNRFDVAIGHLRQAVREDPRESEERIFLSGVFSRPYLPHFFLGWALYRASNDHCEEALAELAESQRQGVVRGFDRLFADLGAARQGCNLVLLPAAKAAARRQLERVDALAAQAATGIADAEAETERLRLVDGWAAARRRLEQATGGDDPLAVGGATRALADLTDALERLLASAGSSSNRLGSEARAANAFSAASGSARDALAAAERQQRGLDALLGDPRHGEARRRQLEASRNTASASLSAARQRLADASTVDEARAVAADAVAVAGRLSQLADAAAAILASEQPTIPAPSPPPSPAVQAPQPSGPDPATVAELRRRVASAERLLSGLVAAGDAGTGNELAALQRRRLTDLVAATRSWLESPGGKGPGDLDERLAASADALRLLAGSERLFSGEPRAALDLLQAIEVFEGRTGAVALLLRSASHFALFRLGGEVDAQRRRLAAGDARGSHALDPDLVPAPQPFSPAFRGFFTAVVGDESGQQ